MQGRHLLCRDRRRQLRCVCFQHGRLHGLRGHDRELRHVERCVQVQGGRGARVRCQRQLCFKVVHRRSLCEGTGGRELHREL